MYTVGHASDNYYEVFLMAHYITVRNSNHSNIYTHAQFYTLHYTTHPVLLALWLIVFLKT